jgi:hypothetical protein
VGKADSSGGVSTVERVERVDLVGRLLEHTPAARLSCASIHNLRLDA